MRILLVEDEPRMADAIRRMIEHEGHAVDVASSGAEALSATSDDQYDAIVLDVMIPAPDGFTVCRELRARGSKAPVMMLTARDGIEDRVAGLDAGADDYLVKPFASEELMARLRAMLRRGPAPRPPTLQIGDVVLDPATREVSRQGRSVQLTSKEFSLVEYLMRNSGIALSREQILTHVWEKDYSGSSNVVDVCVAGIRRKIARPLERPFILTVRGRGYMVRE